MKPLIKVRLQSHGMKFMIWSESLSNLII